MSAAVGFEVTVYFFNKFLVGHGNMVTQTPLRTEAGFESCYYCFTPNVSGKTIYSPA